MVLDSDKKTTPDDASRQTAALLDLIFIAKAELASHKNEKHGIKLD